MVKKMEQRNKEPKINDNKVREAPESPDNNNQKNILNMFIEMEEKNKVKK